MNVRELQQFLQSLRQPLSTAGGKKVADDLERACAGLEPFGDMPIAQFADFLAAAESYARTGVVPTSGRAKAAGRSPKAVDSQAVEAAAERVKSLYERVSAPEVTYSLIEAEVKRLNKEFVKDALLEIARQLGISGSFRTKKAALDEILRRMTERKESYERTRF